MTIHLGPTVKSAATWFALAGLALAVLMLFAMGMAHLLAAMPVSITAGSVAAVALARRLAVIYSAPLQRAVRTQVALLGVVVALGCVIGGTLTGALVQVGIDLARDRILISSPGDVPELLFASLVWVLYVGAVPAVLLGSAFGLLVRRKARQANESA